MMIISPEERGNLRGGVDLALALAPADEEKPLVEEVLAGAGLCFIRNSLSPPKLNDAMSGFDPRKRSSSEWKDILSLPEE
jgi:hypothetical protein